MVEKVKTAAEAIEALGGDAELARRLEVSVQTVWNWRERGLPSRYFLVLNSMLKRKGFSAPASLWGIAEAAE